jgi:alkylation response protein AidB-like acyl-CoA dehydrogenase
MDFRLTPEQQLLRDTARHLLRRSDTQATWKQAQALGWAELGEPGVPGGLLEASIVAIETGRALWPAPFVETIARGRCDVGALLTAAQLVGVSEIAFELALEHVKVRQQFGHPLGSFQAVRHRLAELSGDLDLTRVLVFNAAWLADSGQDARLAIAQAKVSACRSSYRVVMGSHQLHGGVGYAADHRLGRYTRTWLKLESSFGDADVHLTRIQELLGLG